MKLPITIGDTIGRRSQKTFGIFPADLKMHVFAVGQTGTGKSTLLLQLMKQLLERNSGFCLIDPHGDLADALTLHRNRNVIDWNVADPNSPYGYNPLTYVSEQYRPLVASGLIDTLKKQWADAWGARMEHLLRYSILALLSRPGSNLQDVIPMFLNKQFRKQVLAEVTDSQVKSFWYTEYPNMNFKNAADGVAPIANKLGAFLANPIVRKTVCDPKESLRFRKIMDEGRVLIVNLAKGRLGADVSNVLGGMIVSNFAHAAYTRQDLPETERSPFVLFADEFHSFTTDAFAGMMSEIRKFGLSLVLATQLLSNIEQNVLEAVLGNIGTLISFRVGATDAPVLVKQFGADTPNSRDLVNLPNYEMFIKLMIDGEQSRPFSARTIDDAACLMRA
ncbi:MAG: ATP-binding protein [Hyphomicrobiales bacterium]|nr:ATP-binding protein [Hyphomicrobiales bacterium]